MNWKFWEKQNPPEKKPSAKHSGGIRSQRTRENGSYQGFKGAEWSGLRAGWVRDDSETINSILYYAVDVLRARARDMHRNNDMIAGFIAKARRSIIHPRGMLYKPRGTENMSHTELLSEQSRRRNFSTCGGLSRGEFEELVVTSIIRDGEAFIQRVRARNNPTGYQLRLIDASRIFTQYTGQQGYSTNGNRIICGIEVDADYRPLAFYFKGNPSSSKPTNIFTYYEGEVLRIPADDILHLFKKDYPEQVRGYTWIHSAMITAEDMVRYVNTAMTAARQGAAKHMAFASNPETGGAYTGDDVEDGDGDSEKTPVIDMTGETPTVLENGMQMQTFDPSYPHEMFDKFMNTMEGKIATGLDVNQPIFFGNWGDINYSAGQLMLHDEKDRFRREQEWFADSFCRWWHEDWLNWVSLRGDIKFDGRRIAASQVDEIASCDWVGRQFSPADEVKSATAAKIRLLSGISSRRREIEKLGDDPEKILAEIQEEMDLYGDIATHDHGEDGTVVDGGRSDRAKNNDEEKKKKE